MPEKEELNNETHGQLILDVFDSITEGLSILDLDLNIVLVNAWMKKEYADRMPVIGRKCYEVYQRRENPCPWCPARKTLETGQSHRETVPYPAEGDPSSWFLLTTDPLRGRDGRITGIIEHVKDITARKKAEAVLISNHNQLLSIFDGIGEIVYISDPETFEVLYLNQAARDLFGDVTGAKCYEVFQEQDEPCTFCTNEFIMGERAGETHIWEFQNPTNKHWYRRIDRAIRWPDGRLVRYEMAIDIHDQKRIEEELIRHSMVYRSMQEGVLIFDRDGIIIDANPAAEKLFGWSREELLGRKGESLNLPELATDIVADILKRLKNDGLWEGEIPVIIKTGEERVMSTIISSLRDGDGAWIGTIGINRDITEHRKAERAILESERKYRDVVENANEAILIAQDGVIKFSNLKTAENSGYTREELTDKPFVDLIHPDDKQMVSNHYSGRLKGEEVPDIYQFRIITRDGRTRWIEIRAVLMEWMDRPASLNFLSDITERREAEEALRDSRERFRIAAECASDLVYEWEMTTDTLKWYGDIDKALGYKSGEIPETIKAWLALIHPDDTERLDGSVEHHRKTGKPIETEYRIRHRDGHWLYWLDRGTATFDEYGQPVKIIGVCTDITDRRRLEGEQVKSQKLESLGLLAGGIAHDFNNLLMSIMGNISLARLNQPVESDLSEILAEVEASCAQAKNLTQQLLTFSRGGKPVKKTTVISNLIRESTGLALSGTSSRAAFSIADDLWPVNVDPGQLHQVINNLIINAAQAMPDGGTIEVGAENIEIAGETRISLKPGKYVMLSIRDSGIGITEKFISRIYDPYFTTKQQGSGLGLATVYSIIRNHNGLITVKSEPGEGTIFSIHLSAADAHNHDREKSKPSEKITTGKGRILLMDDDEMVRKVMGRMIGRLGYEVVETCHGDEAVEKFLEAREAGRDFNAVILDLTIKNGMGGEDTARELKKLDGEVKLIVSSGYSTSALMAEHEKYGFIGVISKPYRLKDLSELLSRVVR